MEATVLGALRRLLVPTARRRLSGRGLARHFRPAEAIFLGGEPGSALFVVETGQVEISTLTLGGRKVILALLGPGDVIGEVAVLDEGPRSATATAASNTTGRMVGLAGFRAFLKEHPDVHMALTVELCAKLRSANDRLEDRTEKGGDARLARAVLRLAEKFGKEEGGSVIIPIALSQSDLGDLSGLTRANVNRYLRSWAEEDAIRFEKQRLSLLDSERLRRLADA